MRDELGGSRPPRCDRADRGAERGEARLSLGVDAAQQARLALEQPSEWHQHLTGRLGQPVAADRAALADEPGCGSARRVAPGSFHHKIGAGSTGELDDQPGELGRPGGHGVAGAERERCRQSGRRAVAGDHLVEAGLAQQADELQARPAGSEHDGELAGRAGPEAPERVDHRAELLREHGLGDVEPRRQPDQLARVDGLQLGEGCRLPRDRHRQDHVAGHEVLRSALEHEPDGLVTGLARTAAGPLRRRAHQVLQVAAADSHGERLR
ncbi:MAG TPA: hypothetical protein VMD59_21205, partial [Acidimicrobiales bacterium]|nr:hypothetical protein [Acidimicrobiales bacterium]